jgi:cardiolipin synthase
MSWRQLPNTLTATRIALVLPLVWSMQADRFRVAFWIALVAGATDALDGAIAKACGWQSRLGALLDPLADKLLVAACCVALWGAGALPGWLLALVVARDAVIVAGAFAWHGLIAPLEAQPTRLSKLTTAAQLGLVLGLLTALAWPRLLPAPDAWRLAHWGVAALTVASGAQYVWLWGGRAWRARRSGG